MSDVVQRKAFEAGKPISAGTLNAMHNASLKMRGVGGINVRYDASGRAQFELMGAMFPPGFGADYFGIIDVDHPVPRGWLVRNGAAVSRTDYARLFAAVGTTFGNGDGSTTFNLPNDIQRVNVGVGDAAGTVDEYELGDSGGFNLHGKTENNHPDHSFDLDLEHVHDISGGSTGLAAADAGGINVMTPTTTPDTTEPRDWGTADKVPSGTNDAEQGSITRDDDVVTVTLKHRGHVTKATNSGGIDDNVDNRMPYLACWKLIKT